MGHDVLTQYLQDVKAARGQLHPMDYDVFTQLVCHAFIEDVFASHVQTFPGHERNQTRPGREAIHGLTFSVVYRALGTWPRVIVPRWGPRHGRSAFSRFAPTWTGKLQGLFDWRHCAETDRPAWDNKPFRHRTREYYELMLRIFDQEAADWWMDRLGLFARQYLWIIPQYDKDHLCVLYKASKHHHAATRDQIQHLSDAQRMNWIAAYVPSLEKEVWTEMNEERGRPQTYGLADDEPDYARHLKPLQLLYWDKIQALTKVGPRLRGVLCDGLFSRTSLRRAVEVMNMIQEEKDAATAEAEEEDEAEEETEEEDDDDDDDGYETW